MQFMLANALNNKLNLIITCFYNVHGNPIMFLGTLFKIAQTAGLEHNERCQRLTALTFTFTVGKTTSAFFKMSLSNENGKSYGFGNTSSSHKNECINVHCIYAALNHLNIH